MGFFDRWRDEHEDDVDLDSFDEEAYARQHFEEDPRAGWLGGVLPVQFVLARSEDAAVVVTHLAVFPEGFEFTLRAKVRRPKRDSSVPRGMPLDTFPHPGSYRGELPDHVLRFGIKFSDGARVSNVDRDPHWPDATEPRHGMSTSSGGGSNVEYSWDYWAWPAPTEGDLTMVCEWPAYDIAETSQVIRGGDFASALERSERIWPPARRPLG